MYIYMLIRAHATQIGEAAKGSNRRRGFAASSRSSRRPNYRRTHGSFPIGLISNWVRFYLAQC